jgi:hypothetical protein
MNYNADRYGLEVDRIHVGRDFNPEVGFLRRSNFDKSFVNARFSPRPKSDRIRRYFFECLLANYQTASTGHLESRDAQFTFRTQFQSTDQIDVTADRAHEYLQAPFAIAPGVAIPPGSYDYTQLIITHEVAFQRRFSGNITYTGGQFYNGTKQSVSFTPGNSGRVRITPQFYFEPNITLNWVRLPQGAFNASLAGGRLTYTFTPRMFMSALSQYNSSAHSWGTNVRLRWEYTPGSELFVVYSDGFATQDRLALQNRAIAVKVTRLVRF